MIKGTKVIVFDGEYNITVKGTRGYIVDELPNIYNVYIPHEWLKVKAKPAGKGVSMFGHNRGYIWEIYKEHIRLDKEDMIKEILND